MLAGLWHKDGATARHDAVAWGYAKGATQRGVELHQLTEVTDVVVSEGRVTGVKTNRGSVEAGVVIQAVADTALPWRAKQDSNYRSLPIRYRLW